MSRRLRRALPFVVTAALAAACAHEAPPPPNPAPTATPTTAAGASPTAGAARSPTATTAPTGGDAAARAFHDRIRADVDALLTADPVRATRLGDHRFDERWPDLTAEGQAKTAADFRARADALRALAKTVPSHVGDAESAAWETETPALDAALLADELEATAFAATDVKMLERSAAEVVMQVGAGVTSLTTSSFAPKRARMQKLVVRLEALPALLAAARARLAAPSGASLAVMPIVASGLAHSLRDDLAKTPAAELDGDEALRVRLAAAAVAAAAALDAHAAEVSKRFGKGPAKEAPLGADKWATLARLGEGVTKPPSEVRAMGERELARLLSELDALAKEHGRPGEARAAFFHRVAESDPLPPDKVLDAYRASLGRVNGWLHEHPFATVPWERVDLKVVPSPPERRGISFASIHAPGALEPAGAGSKASFEVTAPEASMPKAKRDALSAFHAPGAIDLVTIHEAIPGHDLQILAQHRTKSLVRKVLWAATLGEGWAHYCEQAVVEGGYAGADPVKTRAFYLRMALQRAVRVVLDVGENDGSLTVEQGAKLLEDDAFLAPEAALMEARRAVVAPVNMFAYTYGKLAILEMRRARQEREGARFDAVRFHDDLLALGAIPVDAAARELSR